MGRMMDCVSFCVCVCVSSVVVNVDLLLLGGLVMLSMVCWFWVSSVVSWLLKGVGIMVDLFFFLRMVC